MSGDEVNGYLALAIVLVGGALSISVGLLVAHLLLDERGYWRKWRRP